MCERGNRAPLSEAVREGSRQNPTHIAINPA